MGRHTFAPPVNDRFLGNHVDVHGDGSTGFQRVFDLVLEVSGHAGGMLLHYPKDVVTDNIDIVLRIEAEHVHNTDREELDDQGIIAEDEKLERHMLTSAGALPAG